MRYKYNLILGAAVSFLATSAVAQLTFYEAEGFRGNAFPVSQTIPNLSPVGFNDRASSVVVERGRWQVCEDAGFRGRCVVLQPGQYPSLAPYDLNNRVSSVRFVGNNAQYPNPVVAPVNPTPSYDYRWRPNEKLFEVPVSDVRAVVGPPEQRCWVERQQVVQPAQPNIGGAIIGGILGGVLGHQIGGGRGQDVATGVGAVTGAAVGSNVGRGPGGAYTQDVQRCAAVPGTGQPDYWDVTYYFGGVQHRVQVSTPPGPTIWVNGKGEPRG